MKNGTENQKGIIVTDNGGTVHGYARCSTNETRQDIDRQVRELKAAGATRIWMEYEHGDAETKEQQVMMWNTVSSGDTVIITEPSRLSRSVQQFCQIVDVIKSKSIRLQILGSITIDCRTTEPDPMTVAFLQLIAVFSELELSMIRARVRSGVANAKAKGKQLGRPPITAERIPDSFYRYFVKLQAGEINVTELARLAQVSRPTVYRYLSAIQSSKAERKLT
ncbi:recombinase family protein [uncultured Pseudoflavonifractor sp.]|uniref:recombinase family protein n=1 Tax=uncultured Pseudoflavonifractor sp. TaxID=1221379 RepID=UPI0025DFFC0B|nr:recombinase family protein [uncultured Pseudoflavonifractor sp.]